MFHMMSSINLEVDRRSYNSILIIENSASDINSTEFEFSFVDTGCHGSFCGQPIPGLDLLMTTSNLNIFLCDTTNSSRF